MSDESRNGEILHAYLPLRPRNAPAPLFTRSSREFDAIRNESKALGRVSRVRAKLLTKNTTPPRSHGGLRGLFECAPAQRTRMLRNCQGSLSSMSSGNRPGRPSSGVQSV